MGKKQRSRKQNQPQQLIDNANAPQAQKAAAVAAVPASNATDRRRYEELRELRLQEEQARVLEDERRQQDEIESKSSRSEEVQRMQRNKLARFIQQSTAEQEKKKREEEEVEAFRQQREKAANVTLMLAQSQAPAQRPSYRKNPEFQTSPQQFASRQYQQAQHVQHQPQPSPITQLQQQPQVMHQVQYPQPRIQLQHQLPQTTPQIQIQQYSQQSQAMPQIQIQQYSQQSQAMPQPLFQSQLTQQYPTQSQIMKPIFPSNQPASSGRTVLYSKGTKCTDFDRVLELFIQTIIVAKSQRCKYDTLSLIKINNDSYRFGTRTLRLKLVDDRIIVANGSFKMDLEKFILQYEKPESLKVRALQGISAFLV